MAVRSLNSKYAFWVWWYESRVANRGELADRAQVLESQPWPRLRDGFNVDRERHPIGRSADVDGGHSATPRRSESTIAAWMLREATASPTRNKSNSPLPAGRGC